MITNHAFATSAQSLREFLEGVKGGNQVFKEMEQWNVTTWREKYEARLEKKRKKLEPILHTESVLIDKSQRRVSPDKPRRRVALVIGNANYPTTPLANPVAELSNTLKKLGFKVINIEDANRQTMMASIRTFWGTLDNNTIALFCYSGYGFQYRGKNYLVPTDADMSSFDHIEANLVEVEEIFDEMEQADTQINMLILDAFYPNYFQ